MKKELLFGGVGLLAGIGITWVVATVSVNNNYTSMMNAMGIHTRTDVQGMMDNDDMTMSEMSVGLQGKTGDDFDKAFLSGMIAHHQGAIEMARLVRANTKHDELKVMADDILTAQSKEIDQMQTWQTDWGYKITPQSHQMGH
ncbi:MAG TPA: DUF305 domain-containing protein [Candidatus Saccharimonadales bacterium]|nr:DUF305 domain-containing protein [Candidatus Saccharimonadales bacterium]